MTRWEVPDRADDVDQDSEAILERLLALPRLRPARDHERRRAVRVRQRAPELERERVADERHDRMGQAQYAIQDVGERPRGRVGPLR